MKIDLPTQTLRLATSYIDYLMTLLNSDPENAEFIDDFKVDIHKKWNEKTEEQKRRELVSLSSAYAEMQEYKRLGWGPSIYDVRAEGRGGG